MFINSIRKKKYGTVCVSSGVQLSVMLSERSPTSTTSWNKYRYQSIFYFFLEDILASIR
ncbi:unnamed protein product [Acanthoscelides obtectus]|uniref:Uncharacterized protein n=1 Tax=Acanthoscelides obtectus TaxID=200917 RepID=A0A9P0PPQ5_ACAOB|nr:unnamed protein product [Acanthoscelides obtectus]CAK1664900.1 hypothetical protein AOBTE_LOCUS24538 [Acanthoscelides obtectus]